MFQKNLKSKHVIFTSLLCLQLILSNCSGRVEVQDGVGSTKIAAAQTSSYSADVALDEIESNFAQNNLDGARNIVELIPSRAGAEFSWQAFWLGLNQRGLYTLSSPALKTAFLDLSKTSCTDKDYQAFARFLILEKEGFEYLTQGCQATLDVDLTSDLVTAIWKKSKELPETSTKALFQLYSLLSKILKNELHKNSTPTKTEFNKALNRLQYADWEFVAEILYKTDKNIEPLIDLLEVFNTIRGSAVFADRLSAPLIKDHNLLSARIKNFGLMSVLGLLENTSINVFGKVLGNNFNSPDDITNLLDKLDIEFTNSTALSDSSEPLELERAWLKNWIELSRLRSILNKFAQQLPLPYHLLKVEGWHRSFEKILLKDPVAALRFLTEYTKGTADGAWLSYRTLVLSKSSDLNSVLLPIDSNHRIDSIIEARLAIHLSKAPLETQEKIQAYCALLQGNGLQPKQYEANELTRDPSLLRRPGCHKVRTETLLPWNADRTNFAKTIELGSHEQDFIMPFDSVLIAHAQTIHIQARKFEGSIFELSANQEFEAYPVPETPENFDALVFPIVAGVMDPADSNHVQFMAFHFPFQKAKTAEEVIQWINTNHKLQSGIDGGDLNITGKEKSGTLVLSSIAGKGQKWNRTQIVGGKSMESSFFYMNIYGAWWDNILVNPVDEIKGKRLTRFEAPLNIAESKELLKNINTSGFKLYLPLDHYNAVEKNVSESILRACKYNSIDSNSVNKKCLTYIGEQSTHWLKEVIKRSDRPNYLSFDEFQESNFGLKDGGLANLISESTEGKNGEIHD